MNIAEVKKLIRAACDAIEQPQVYIIGSQAIHAAILDHPVPSSVSRSREVDMFPAVDDALGTVAARLEALTGVLSDLDDELGVYVDTVDPDTGSRPHGWKDRVIPLAADGEPPAVGLCLEPNDLCVSKLAAHRDQDFEFVAEVLALGIADTRTIRRRMGGTTMPAPIRHHVRDWLDAYDQSGGWGPTA